MKIKFSTKPRDILKVGDRIVWSGLPEDRMYFEDEIGFDVSWYQKTFIVERLLFPNSITLETQVFTMEGLCYAYSGFQFKKVN